MYHELNASFMGPRHTATHCKTLQHTATHCNTLLHTRSQQVNYVSRTRSQSVIYVSSRTSQSVILHNSRTRSQSVIYLSSTKCVCHFPRSQHTATHCNTLQHTATHCNTPTKCEKCVFHFSRHDYMKFLTVTWSRTPHTVDTSQTKCIICYMITNSIHCRYITN